MVGWWWIDFIFYFIIRVWMWFSWRCANECHCILFKKVNAMANRFILLPTRVVFGVTGVARGFVCCMFLLYFCCWCSCCYLSTIVCGLSRDHVANKCYQIFYLFGCMKTCVHRIAKISISNGTKKRKKKRKKLKSHSVLKLEWMKQTGHRRREYTFALRLLFFFYHFLVGTTKRFECRVKYVRECIFTFHSWPCAMAKRKAFRSNIFMVFNMRVTFEMDGNFSLHSYCAFAASIYSFCAYFSFVFCGRNRNKKIRYQDDIHNVHSKK